MKLRRRNPEPTTIMRHALSAVGLGLGVAGASAALGEIYRRPSIALGGLVLGVGLTALHFPWSRIGAK